MEANELREKEAFIASIRAQGTWATRYVARQIFGEIEQDFEESETLYTLHIAKFRWQALKEKWCGKKLEEGKKRAKSI